MQKIKILAVAPYEGMAEAIASIARERDDIELTVQIGDLDTGRKIAMELAHKNYDVILSRGGTAELIRSTMEIPVIDISISGYDILRAIKLAESYSGKFVIAGFAGITGSARVLCDLLQYDIDILTFTCEEDALPALRAARKKGCTLVLCDMAASKAAEKLGLNAILISSGTESINDAINEAVKLIRSSLHVHKQKYLFQELLTKEEQEFIIYDPSGSLWFSSLALDAVNDSLMNLVQTYLQAFLKLPDQRIARQIRDKVYTLTSRHLYYAGQKYTAVTILQKEALFAGGDTGISIYNKADYLPGDFPVSSSFGQDSITQRLTAEYCKSSLPVLITGESGTGKDNTARHLYENGPFCNAPFYEVNCGSMNERKWSSLIDSDHSPLNSVHTTLYFKHADALSNTQIDKLCTYIEHTNQTKRNRLIFSLLSGSRQDPECEYIRRCLESRLSCLTVRLRPLRERTKDLPSLTALYLHKLNVTMGKQIIGFATEAMDLMTAFPWPDNLNQLQHVLKELVVITHSPYIAADDVRQILDQEPCLSCGNTADIDLSGTLDAINFQIIQTVLAEEGGNKEKTSHRLGISRSTLWRILKNHNI